MQLRTSTSVALPCCGKNHASVGIVVNASDYATVIAELKAEGSLSYATRFDLAVKAFEHTAQYDGMIASYLGARVGKEEGQADKFPRTFNTQLNKAQDLRYGENPHQSAAFYIDPAATEASVATAKQLKNYLIIILLILMQHLNV